MKIGIDARLIEETGVGRYIRNLIRELALQDKTNEYVVFLRAVAYDTFGLPNSRWTKVLAEVHWHTFAEQLLMPWIFLKARLDLIHIPYFNIPIFYPGNMVVTIHDLTILHFDTGKATMLPLPLYKLRRLGYYIALAVGLRRAVMVIAVSNATKQEIIDHFHIDERKIRVTYEGVDNKLRTQNSKLRTQKRRIKDPYFLYVGNAYPHKNLEILMKAFQKLISQGLALRGKARPYENGRVRLVLVGKDDFFYRRLKEEVKKTELNSRLVFFGQANDAELADLYHHALALVFPSFMEGFGLPALEALANDCPVIASDIPVFHEILGRNASYVNPYRVEELIAKLREAAAGTLPKPVPHERDFLLQQFSWESMAQKTLDIYKQARHL